MNLSSIKTSPAVRLAERLASDIARRGLAPGDRYLTAREAGDFLGVSAATAHRALVVLARRKMLIRQKHGTFIGSGVGAGKKRSRLKTVYLLVREDEPTPVPFDAVLPGIRREMPDVNVQATFVPAGTRNSFMRDFLTSASLAGETAGVLPISCPCDVYSALFDAGLPTVILGTPFAQQQDKYVVDVDNREAGRLLAKHLVTQGHRRLALVLSGEGRPGDHDLLDGISEVLTACQLPHNSLVFRFGSPDQKSLRGLIHRLLTASDRPTAVMTQGLSTAETVAAVAAEVQLKRHDDLEIVFNDQLTDRVERAPFTHVRTREPFSEMAALAARMLVQIGRGEKPDPAHVVLPVELHVL